LCLRLCSLDAVRLEQTGCNTMSGSEALLRKILHVGKGRIFVPIKSR